MKPMRIQTTSITPTCPTDSYSDPVTGHVLNLKAGGRIRYRTDAYGTIVQKIPTENSNGTEKRKVTGNVPDACAGVYP
jgi:hypothetical protein